MGKKTNSFLSTSKFFMADGMGIVVLDFKIK